MSGGPDVLHKQARVALLDHQRAHTTEIILSKIKQDFDVVLQVVREMRFDRISPECVESIRQLMPTSDERARFEAFQGAECSLATKADRFFSKLVRVPRLQSKLEALWFVFQIETTSTEIDLASRGVIRASTDIRKSSRLKTLLGAVVDLGNALNGTERGGRKTRGIRLDQIGKLRDTRSFDGKTTLLHFLISQIEQCDPGALDVASELGSLDEATAKVHFRDIDERMRAMRRGLEALQREVSIMAGECEDGGERKESADHAALAAVCESSSQVMGQLGLVVSDAKAEFSATAKFFCEPAGAESSAEQPSQFFGTVRGFISHFEAAKTKEREKIEICKQALTLPVDAEAT